MNVELAATMPVTAATKTEAAYQALRSWIESGRLAPNTNLRISALAAELGMSPTPIREALRLLQSQGLVVHDPHRGMRVHEFGTTRVDEVYELRLALEPLAARLAAERATEERLDELWSLHRRLTAAVQAGSPEAYTEAVALNARWHLAVCRASGSATLLETMERLWSLVPIEAMWTSSRAAESLTEHELVMEALASRAPAAAALRMRGHLERGRRRAVARLHRR